MKKQKNKFIYNNIIYNKNIILKFKIKTKNSNYYSKKRK